MSTSNNPKVAIILINYKDYAERFLKESYESLLKQTFKNFDIYISDNASTKASRKTITKIAPEAILVPIKENSGWAAGNNAAIRLALNNNYDYFFIANMDTVFDVCSLNELISFQRMSNYDIVQSKILIHGKNVINSLGNRIHFLGYGYCNCYGKNETCTLKNEQCRVDYVSGAAMLITKNVINKVGLFREEFFMYHDDLEYCYRARLSGFKLGVAEKSIVYHKYSFSSTYNLIYYMERNRLVVLLAFYQKKTLLLILPLLLPFEILMLFYYMLQGNGKNKFKAMFYPFTRQGRGLIKNIRKEVREIRIINDKDIVSHFSGELIFPELDSAILQKVVNPLFKTYWNFVKKFI